MNNSCECSTWARTEPPLFTEHHPRCQKYEKKMIRVWTVTPGVGLSPCTERDLGAVIEWIRPGETIKIVVRVIDEAVYNELPEYAGP